MTLEIILVMAILTALVLLFISGWVRLDIVPLMVPLALIVTKLVSPEEVFSGFSSSAVITVASLFVIGAGLVRSGVVNYASEYLKRITGSSYFRLVLTSTALPGFFAGFINVTATVFFFVPTVMRIALQSNISRSRLLLPMAVTSLLGANLTLIGASHNLVVNSLLNKSAGVRFSFFELMPVGACLLGIAVVYNLLLGSRLLPAGNEDLGKTTGSNDDLVKVYDLDDRLWELWVKPKSLAVGKSLRQAGLGEHYGLSLIAIVRAEEQMHADQIEMPLQAEDLLLVLGREEKVKAFADQEGLFLAGRPREQKAFPLSTAEIVEVVVPPRSPVIGKTLRELSFRENTGLSCIALWQKGKPLRTDVGTQLLQEGDGLLLFGDRKKTRGFKPGKSFRWLHPPQEEEAPSELRPLAPFAALLLMFVVISAAVGWLPIAVAALSGAAGMVILKVITPQQAYRSVEWRTIILIGCLFPLGIALGNSGASALLATVLVNSWGHFGPTGVLLGVAFIAMLLTQPLHNVAVAVIMTPVALDVAQTLDANPKTFAVAVIVGASAAFLMPVGHPAPLFVQQLGNYNAKDYLRFGIGLNLLVLMIIALVVPQVWPY